MLDSIKNWFLINVVKNWKTTLSGVLIGLILLAVYNGKIDKETGMYLMGTLVSYGLIIAKDGNKTGLK